MIERSLDEIRSLGQLKVLDMDLLASMLHHLEG